MSEIQSCFRRCEKKYLLTPEQYREMLTGYRVLKVAFPYLIPFGECCDRCGIDNREHGGASQG